ncbi:MAG: carbohydrate ABC transporter permease [Propionicimonas sp.]|nr:carbohydrate ABC transporter permease [Propionicimonas sp.]
MTSSVAVQSTHSERRRRARLIGGLAQIPLILWTLVTVLPFLLIFLLSFRSNTDIYSNPLGISQMSLENYATAWTGPGGSTGMAQYFANTLIAAAVALVLALGAGAPAAYFGTQLAPALRKAFTTLFMVANVVPLVLVVVPYFQIFNAVSMLNQPLLLGVAYGALALPTTVLVLGAFYADFPHELIEAAAIDGLGELSAFARIVAPLSKGAFTAVAMLALVFVWGEAQLGIVLLQDPDAQTLTVGLLGFKGQFYASLGPLFAGLSLAALPIIGVYLVFQRHVTKGIALGGVFR